MAMDIRSWNHQVKILFFLNLLTRYSGDISDKRYASIAPWTISSDDSAEIIEKNYYTVDGEILKRCVISGAINIFLFKVY